MSRGCCPDYETSPKAPQETVTEVCCELHPPQKCGPAKCPECGELGKTVQRITLGALLRPEKRPEIPKQKEFCFCRSATCAIVYFAPDRVLFRKDDLSVAVGLKEPQDPAAPVCYCFGWTPEKIQAEIRNTGKSTVTDQIKAQVKAGNCYCEVTNPQGTCCLGDVSKAVKEIKEKVRLEI
ncbi:MAG: copper chaperone Copz family protein [Candidatus Omnitrophica bacterium]|nr:copper chaperone Copz family protein [Candidatus Omnitrophota bacterium]